MEGKNKLSKQQLILLEELSRDYDIYIIIDRCNIIDSEIYVCNEFREATNNTKFHSLRVFKRITDIVDRNSSYVNSNNSLKIITDKIDDMVSKISERKYSKEFYWIKF